MVFPESQWVTVSFRLPRSNQTPPPPPQPQASCPQRFSALLGKYTLRDSTDPDHNFFTGNEGDESDIDTSDNDSDSGGSDDKVRT